MKKLLLLMALAALPSFGQFGNATRLQGVPICAPLTLTDGWVVTYDTTSACFKTEAGGGGSVAFSSVTAGTNAAALVVGTGGSLGVSGTGTITATHLGSGSYVPLLTAGAPSAALAANITGLFSGSCPTGATCALASDGTKQTVSAFPYSYQRGTFLGAGLNLNSSAGIITNPFSNTFNIPAACSSPSAQYWQMPIGGFLRNITGTTGITNATTPIRWMLAPGCPNAALLSSGGPVTRSGVAAGGVIESWADNQAAWWRVGQWSPLAMGYVRMGNTATATPAHVAVEFVSADGLQGTILGQSYVATLTASSTQFFGFGGGNLGATESAKALPIPIAGTFKNLFVSSTTTPTATVAVTFRKNSADTTLVATIGTTDNGGVQTDVVNTVSAVAGDLVDIQTVSGASTQTTVQATGVYFTPTTAGETFVWGNWDGATVTTTNKYNTLGSPLTGTTIAAMEATMPFACTITNLYVNQAAANGGTTVTTFTLMKNGSTTAVTGTIGVGPTGAQLVYSGAGASWAAGDLITLQAITNTGTSGAMGGWSAKCV